MDMKDYPLMIMVTMPILILFVEGGLYSLGLFWNWFIKHEE